MVGLFVVGGPRWRDCLLDSQGGAFEAVETTDVRRDGTDEMLFGGNLSVQQATRGGGAEQPGL